MKNISKNIVNKKAIILSKTPGVYIIKFLINNKVYIGSSVNMYKRTYNHYYAFVNNTHYNIQLQRFVNKYGINSLIFEIVEECNISELVEKEQFYLDKFDSFNKGFNARPICNSPLGTKRTEKQKLERSIFVKKKYEENPHLRELDSIRAKEYYKNNPNTKIKISESCKKANGTLEKRELFRKQTTERMKNNPDFKNNFLKNSHKNEIISIYYKNVYIETIVGTTWLINKYGINYRVLHKSIKENKPVGQGKFKDYKFSYYDY